MKRLSLTTDLFGSVSRQRLCTNYQPQNNRNQSRLFRRMFVAMVLLFTVTGMSVAQERALNLGEFTKISVHGIFNVILVPSDRCVITWSEDLEIFGGALTLQDIASVDRNTLRLQIPEHFSKNTSQRLNQSQKGEIFIHFKSLDELRILGAARVVRTENPIKETSLKFNISGAASANLTIEVEDLTTTVYGASNLTLSGTVENHDLKLSGASGFHGTNLAAQQTSVDISGASSARITTQKISGSVSGASRLTHNPDAEGSLSRSGTSTITGTSGTGGVTVSVGGGGVTIIQTKEPGSRKGKKFSPTFGFFDIGINGYGKDPFQYNLPANYENMALLQNTSFVLNLNVLQYGLRLGRSDFGVATSLGIGWNNFKFLERDMIPEKQDGVFVIDRYDGEDNRDFRKSRIQSSWLRVPLALQYNKRNGFNASMGVVGNVRLGSSSKQVYTQGGGKKERHKANDDLYLNGLRADAEVRVGYRQVSAFATYSLTNMFLKNKGPELTMFSFGLSFFPAYGW